MYLPKHSSHTHCPARRVFNVMADVINVFKWGGGGVELS
jgi:hypothetical protein